MIALYVDDLVVASNDPLKREEIVKQFNDKYKMKNIGELKQLLGLNVNVDKKRGRITIKQTKYVHQLLEKFGMANADTKPTPADRDVKLSKDMSPKTDAEKTEMAKVPYRELIGALMYLSVGTRPDISFAVSELSKFLVSPGKQHWNATKHVLRYLKGTAERGITYCASVGDSDVSLRAYADFEYKGPSKNELRTSLKAYSDADWGGDKDTRRSHTRAVILLAGGPIAWMSKKQSCVAMSSAEAEYMAASQTCREVVWIRMLLAGLGFKQNKPTVIFEDNSACIQMSKNPVLHSRTKHIDLHYHFVRERSESAEVKLEWLSTERMIADILTKPLPAPLFASLCEMLFGACGAEPNV